MSSESGSVSNCGNTVTTTRGTYTFYDEVRTRSESKKLCKKHGGIIATLNTQEEFEAVHKFAYKCDRWGDFSHRYHIGLYVYKDEMFYSDCTAWDYLEHPKLYKIDNANGPCWNTIYRPYKKRQKIYSNIFCYDHKHRTICFNAFDNATTKAEEIVQSNVGFSSFNILALLIAAVAIGFAIVSMKKSRKYEEKLAELEEHMRL